MMIKKKFICSAMAVLLIACGAPEEDEPIVTPSTVETADDQKEENNAPKKAEITETLLYDANGITVTANSLNLDGFMGPEVKLNIRNESDKNITVQTGASAVNGMMFTGTLSEDVAAGKTANSSISFLNTEMDANNIKTIGEMTIDLHIYDTDAWQMIDDPEPVTLKTTADGTFTQECDDSGDVIYDNNGIKVVCKGLNPQDSWIGPGIELYIENNSDQYTTIQTCNTSINDIMIDPVFSQNMMPHTKVVTSISFLDKVLTDNNIETISKAEFNLRFFSTKDMMQEPDSDKITLSFN